MSNETPRQETDKFESMSREELIGWCNRFKRIIEAAVQIRRYFKGTLFTLSGAEPSDQFFDREMKEIFGLTFTAPETKKRGRR